jgi:hypothetical protein
MNFYVTLPSNGSDLTSEYGKLNNTKSDFESELKIPLDLEYKKYEVGLTEISFNKSFNINIGRFILFDTTLNKNLFDVQINMLDGQPFSEVLTMLNIHLNTFESTNTDDKIAFIISNKTGQVEITVPETCSLEIKGYFASLLESTLQISDFGKALKNFNQPKFHSLDHITIYPGLVSSQVASTCTHLNYIQQLYIYTNIIDEVHVGNEMLKLMRVVTVRGELNQNISEIFTVPHYLPLDSSYIERIRMFVCDVEGNKIDFHQQKSNVIYKLHFKLK